MILNLNLRPASRHLGDFYRSNDLLIFQKRRGRRSVRHQHAVNTEVSIGRKIPITSAVVIICLSVFFRTDSVIVPLPDKTSLKTFIFTEQVLVGFQSSRSVSHGMAILTQHMRLVPFHLGFADLFHSLDPRIHGGVYISHFRLEVPFVVNQQRRIQLPDLFCRTTEITAKT